MGTRYNRLIEAVLTSTHNLCFEQKYEKYTIFLPENFPFLVGKFSIYLNRSVFVMASCVKSHYSICEQQSRSLARTYAVRLRKRYTKGKLQPKN